MLTALWSSTAAALTLPQAPAIVHAQYGERAASAPTPMPTAGVFPREGLFLADNELVEEVVVTAVIAPDSPAMTLPKVQVPALPNLDLSKVYSPATMDKLSNIQKQAGALYIDPKALDEQAGALYGKLKDQASSIDQKEIERQLKAAQKALEDNAPIIQKGLDSALIETQKSLKVAEPVLKKTADDLTPVLQSAGEQALTQLTPVLQKGLDTAGGEASGLLNSLGASLSPFVGQAQKAAEDALNSAASSIDKELQDVRAGLTRTPVPFPLHSPTRKMPLATGHTTLSRTLPMSCRAAALPTASRFTTARLNAPPHCHRHAGAHEDRDLAAKGAPRAA